MQISPRCSSPHRVNKEKNFALSRRKTAGNFKEKARDKQEESISKVAKRDNIDFCGLCILDRMETGYHANAEKIKYTSR